ncbi:MAG: hypothetical protein IJS60_05280 [Abditibacteriota bacterium]|nr:hypothetical protein [Abditibacteriota bacterium]
MSLFNEMEPFRSKVTQVENPHQWNPLTFDSVLEFYPWRHYLGQSYREGKRPVNNDFSFSGKSFFIGNGQSAYYYPLNFLYAIFSTPVAFTIFVILHVLLLQIFMYIFLRRLKLCQGASVYGAVAFGFCGYSICWLALPTFISVITYLPLTLYFIHRAVFVAFTDKDNEQNDSNKSQKSFTGNSFFDKSCLYAILAGLSYTLCILSGHLQIAFFVGIGALIYGLSLVCLYAKRIGLLKVLLMVVLILIPIICIGSLQLIPSLKSASVSHRNETKSETHYNWVINNSMEKWRLITIFVPKAFGSPDNSKSPYGLVGFATNKNYHINSTADYIEFSAYAGVITLLLVMISLGNIKRKQTLFWWVWTLLFLWMSCGSFLYKIIFYGIPGASAFGAPSRMLCLFLFGLSVLSAIGMDWFIKSVDLPKVALATGTKIRPISMALWLGLIGLFILFFIAFNLFMNGLPQPIFAVTFAKYKICAPLFFLFSGIGVIILLIMGKRTVFNINSAICPYLLVLVLFVDLFVFGANFNETCKPSWVYPDLELTDKLKELQAGNDKTVAVITGSWNMFEAPHTLLPPNMLMYYGIREVGGYDSLFLGSYKKDLEALAGESVSPIANGNMIMLKKSFEGIEKVADYIISLEELEQYERIGVYNNVNLYRTK